MNALLALHAHLAEADKALGAAKAFMAIKSLFPVAAHEAHGNYKLYSAFSNDARSKTRFAVNWIIAEHSAGTHLLISSKYSTAHACSNCGPDQVIPALKFPLNFQENKLNHSLPKCSPKEFKFPQWMREISNYHVNESVLASTWDVHFFY